MPVAHAVLGLEHERLRLDAGDARRLGLAENIVLGQRIELLGQQRRKGVAVGSRLDADDFRVRVVAADLVVVANHLARRTVEIEQFLVLAARVDHVHDARGFDPAVVLVEQRADVVELARGGGGMLQPLGGVVGERRSAATAARRCPGRRTRRAGQGGRSLPRRRGYSGASGVSDATARRYGRTPWIAVVGEYS